MPGLTTDAAPPTTGLADAALAFLRDLADRRTPPAEALGRLATLRARHPGVRLDLVWDVEPFDGSVHYDLLVRDGDRTTSLSVTPAADSLPWPLRGAQRVGDSVLLEVDGERLEIGEAVRLLDTLDDEPGAGIADRLVVACLLRAELATRVAALGEEEAARAVASYRSRFGLEDDEALARWCRVRGQSPADFRTTALTHLTLARLRRDGVDGLPLDAWLDRRRETADIRWHWIVGPEAGERP